MPVADGHPSFCIYLRLTYGGINYPAIYVALLLEDYFIFHNFVERSKKQFYGNHYFSVNRHWRMDADSVFLLGYRV